MAKKIKGKEVKWKSLSHVWLFVTHGLYSPRNSAGQNTGVDSFSFLQRIFPTQGNKTKKTPNQHKFRTKWLQCEFYQTFRKELTPIIFKQFQKSCSCRDTYTFILPSQHHPDTKKKRERASSHTKRKLHANISDEREYKNP